jgi:uncharacterized protein (TIGR02118 family)
MSEYSTEMHDREAVMIVVFSLMRRRDNVSLEEFQQHWLDPHGSLVCKFPRLRRYSQNHVITLDDALPLDGFAELAYDTDADQEEATRSPEMAACDRDSPLFIGSVVRVVTRDRVVLPPPSERTSATKHITVFTGQPDMVEPVLTEYRAMVRESGGLIGLVENLPLRQRGPRSLVPVLDVPIAAIVELWFADKQTPTYRIAPEDETHAVHPYLVTEHRFI